MRNNKKLTALMLIAVLASCNSGPEGEYNGRITYGFTLDNGMNLNELTDITVYLYEDGSSLMDFSINEKGKQVLEENGVKDIEKLDHSTESKWRFENDNLYFSSVLGNSEKVAYEKGQFSYKAEGIEILFSKIK